ncbi:tetratricopeptide (TPR) repeat protein [Duganella sp. 1411]|uniref:tetratricopeptide repeat protein n=1 Tax=Duganella sp. 1411 TaxID=2806572 RepID=UPI001AE4D6D0|nr:tetratricopeptide repeat protein [Duganella sp. 1411]MBP1208292.1 tetratricopeptide (TPR) repeat protein [Duganella sp. 1411]
MSQPSTTLYQILPAAPALPPSPTGSGFLLDASFAHQGVWAGVSDLLDLAYQHFAEQGRQDILDQHNYVLHMLLPQRRDAIPLKYACLTDTATNSEKTRNYSLDRAYRLIHGAVTLVAQWRAAVAPGAAWTVVVRRFDQAGHLARRFFFELGRRLGVAGKLSLYVDSGRAPEAAIKGVRLAPIDAATVAVPLTALGPAPGDGEPRSFAALEHADMSDWERHYVPLLRHYQAQQDGLMAARVAMRALCVHNHFGYYHEASSFVDTVLPHLDQLVEDDQSARWNYVGNIFQSLVTTGKEQAALAAVERHAAPRLTETVLQAKMHYLLAMVHLRYLRQQDVPLAQHHIDLALQALQAAQADMPADDHAFLSVFINNGLAFVRVRQGRPDEALALCQGGFDFLTSRLGQDVHRLHRSVLLYNSAQVLSALGKQEEALDYYRQSMAMDPYYSEYYNESGNILQRLGRYDEALALYDQAILYSAPYAEVYFNKGNCHAQLEQWEPALACLAYSLELNPDQAEAYLLRAEILEMQERADEALADYGAAIALNGDHVAARVNRAVIHYGHGRFADALDDMNHVLTLEPAVASHYENRSEIYKAMNQPHLQLRDLDAVRQYGEAA